MNICRPLTIALLTFGISANGLAARIDEQESRAGKFVQTAQVDPWTATTTVAAVLSFTFDMLEAGKTREWRKNVDKKLDHAIILLEAIVEDLKKLRIDFKTELTNAFRNDLYQKLNAYVSLFDVRMTDIGPDTVLTKSQRSELTQLRAKAEETSFRLIGYGPAGYHAVALGMLLTKATYDVIQWPISEQKVFLTKFEQTYSDWLENRPGTVTFALAQNGTKQAGITSKLRSVTGRRFMGEGVTTGFSGPERTICIGKVWLEISGSIDSGFSGSLAESDVSCNSQLPPNFMNKISFKGSSTWSEPAVFRDFDDVYLILAQSVASIYSGARDKIVADLNAKRNRLLGLRTEADRLAMIKRDLEEILARTRKLLNSL